jgi:hypothetical protein
MSQATVILSPHFDDAVLSCWHLLAGTGDVLVVNVFGGEPAAGTLGWWDRLAGASDSAASVRARVDEDRQALALAGRVAVNLPFLDGQYREADQAPGEIVRALRGVLETGSRVYAPAALGDHHRDHTAVRAAALALHAEGADVALYADVPHATMHGWPRWVTGERLSRGADRANEQWAGELLATGVRPERMVAEIHRLSSKDRAAKLRAVRAYASQIAPLQHGFRCSLQAPELLGLEVEWRLSLVE